MSRACTALLLFLAVLTAPTGVLFAALVWEPPAPHSHETRLARIAPAAKARLAPYFRRAGLAWPPTRIVLVGLKRERLLRLYAAGTAGDLRYVRDYRIVGSSGKAGPKLGEDDGQVPEGIYPVDYLNPNSVAYLSLKVGYPNAFDRAMAAHDGRRALGGDIMIHGPTRATRGCLALSQSAIEEVYAAVAAPGAGSATVIVSPADILTGPLPQVGPAWTRELHARIARALASLPTPLQTWRRAELDGR